MLSTFSWEKDLASAVGLSTSQLRHMIALYSSAVLSLGLRLIGSRTGRHLYAIAVGILLLLYPFGAGCCHAVIPSLATYLAMKFFPKKAAFIGWGLTFPYLVILQDGHGKQELTGYRKSYAINECPSVLEFTSYILSCGNLLVGPHFEFRDYRDYMNRTGVWEKSVPFSLRQFLSPLAEACLWVVVYQSLIGKYSVELLTSEAFDRMNLPRKFGTCWLVAFVNRAKYYHAWKIPEVGFNISGFGYTDPGQEENGSSKQEWKRGVNMNPFQIETADSFSVVATNWNINTGNFLRRYAYERLAPSGKKPGFWALCATQMISGLWHGLYAGYWLFFFSTAVCIAASRAIHKWKRTLPARTAMAVRIPAQTFVALSIGYMTSAFMILNFREVIHLWKSMYFIPHIICLLAVTTLRPGKESKKKTA